MKSTFNRIEKKYIIDQSKYELLTRAFNQHLNDDFKNHETYKISNVYYDTEDNLLIKKSIAKPKFKQKLRLRAYGKANDDSIIFLEIKKKINGYVNKRRTKIKVSEARDLVENNLLPDIHEYHNEQVLKEIQYFTKQYLLKPAVYLYYEREVFSSLDKDGLRITFDKNIRTRRNHVDITDLSDASLLLEGNLYVLEIKTNSNMPFWLTETLNELEIFSTSFSKYGSEFYQYLNKIEGDKQCINPYLECLK